MNFGALVDAIIHCRVVQQRLDLFPGTPSPQCCHQRFFPRALVQVEIQVSMGKVAFLSTMKTGESKCLDGSSGVQDYGNGIAGAIMQRAGGKEIALTTVQSLLRSLNAA
jgi:hypothetical protein